MTQTIAPTQSANYVGTSQRKHNGDKFLRGEMIYIDDVRIPGMHFAGIVRSPHPHARIKSVDLSKASNAEGVVFVLSGEDAAKYTDPIPHFISPEAFGGKTTDVRCLAVDKVVYVGEPVAAVVAQTRQDAEAAVELVEVEYEVLPFVIDGEESLKPEAPRIYEHWDDNKVISIPFISGDTEAVFAEAEHILEDELKIQRYSTQPIEPRGYVAVYDVREGSYTFHGACQNPHPLRWVLAHTLRVSENDVRVIAPTVGGAFGLKMHGHPEEPLICILSKLSGKPVKWIEDRTETMLVGAREQMHRFKVSFTSAGKITALKDHFIANVGALGAPPGWGMVFLSGLAFPTGYKIGATDVLATVVATNKSPWNAARGYGKEATALVMERIIDLVARELQMDPLEVRRVNLIEAHEFPYKTAGGLNIDSGDYHAALDKAVTMIGLPALRAEQEELRKENRYLGIGFAFELTPESGDIPGTLVGGFDTSTVKMDPSGKVTVLTGVTTPGGGNDTSILQIVADQVGIEMSDARIIQGDTLLTPYGFGNYSGRSMVTGGNAAYLAAKDIRAKLLVIASRLLEIDESDIDLRGGWARSLSDPSKAIKISEIAYTVYTLAFATATGVEPPLESTRVYQPDNIQHTPDAEGKINIYPTYSNAVHVAVVEVDAETGHVKVRRFGTVHDAGTIINPRFVEGQMEGATTMGIGAALMEHSIHDPATGHLSTNRFKTYLMPRASDVPMFESVHQITPSPYTALGTKGAGEAGVGGAQAAVSNAVHDALAPLGITIRQMPLNPQNVLHAITTQRTGQQA
ncbi:xanthine dehydrogenase family protein molybdopterin-binding subunit [Arthrobacter sp. AQ5-05]|uniref:xanthine dehydrogenase family protein molybdopterin-binding subunit n=1 Tax=Arthrobacter sp. AQ5-05 TaxID=2184581 RepID=UPI0012B6466A|nr:xanthine dehydrogenase family protein molybdopterin-binding subunit [Arthrobacter sp. AQ5-05]